MNVSLKLGRLGKAHASAQADALRSRSLRFALTRTIAGLAIVELVVAGFIHLPTSNSQRVDWAIGQSPRFCLRRDCWGKRSATANAIDLPILTPIVSSDDDRPASERAGLGTTAGVAVKEEQPIRLSSAQIALKEAQVAVSLSQAQLAQARINLTEFQAKHNSAKILSAQGQVSRQEVDTAKAAHKLAQLQHSSAEIGLQDSKTQLIVAKAEVRKLECKANTVNQM